MISFLQPALAKSPFGSTANDDASPLNSFLATPEMFCLPLLYLNK